MRLGEESDGGAACSIYHGIDPGRVTTARYRYVHHPRVLVSRVSRGVALIACDQEFHVVQPLIPGARDSFAKHGIASRRTWQNQE
jgi:hypothetical protein